MSCHVVIGGTAVRDRRLSWRVHRTVWDVTWSLVVRQWGIEGWVDVMYLCCWYCVQRVHSTVRHATWLMVRPWAVTTVRTIINLSHPSSVASLCPAPATVRLYRLHNLPNPNPNPSRCHVVIDITAVSCEACEGNYQLVTPTISGNYQLVTPTISGFTVAGNCYSRSLSFTLCT